jgi:hypothetical protein
MEANAMATDIVLTQSDVDDIAQKLDEFGAVLNDREKVILLATLALAGQGIAKAAQAATPEKSPSPAPPTLPSLSSGFRNAFQKGIGSHFSTNQTDQTEKISGTAGITWSN